MTILRGLFERRATLNSPTVPLTELSLLDWLGGPVNDSGVQVNQKSAFQNPAVYRAIDLLSGTMGSLPLLTYKTGTRDLVPTGLLDAPNPAMTPLEFWELLYLHRYSWGNAFALKNYDGAGRIREIWPVDPAGVTVHAVPATEANPAGRLFECRAKDGGTRVVSQREIFHIRGKSLDGVTGMSPISLYAQGIGLAMAAQRHGAKFFSSGQLFSGILQSDAKLDETKADELAARWRSKVSGMARAHDIVVLGSGAKFQPVSMSNSDAQLLESRKFEVIETARIYGVPPHLLMDVERSTSWGTGIEQQTIGFVTFTMKAELSRVEQRVTKELTPAGVQARYKIRDLQRGDATARSAYYQVMSDIGAYSVNDVLADEDMPGIGPEGDIRTKAGAAAIPTKPDLSKEPGDDPND